jgi:tetratricopeptide (TPR) repeat protein
VADGKSRRVLCFEQNPERHVAKFVGGDAKASPEASTFGYANIYLDPELGNSEVALYGSYWRHNLGRHQRVNELLKSNAGQLGPAQMGGILADQGATARCRIRDSIAMVMTVGSVVFSPEDGAVWVGVGKAPTSRGEFIPFSFKELGEAKSLQRFTTPSPADSGADVAFEQFRRAYVAYLDRNDTAAALGHIETALELAPEQSIYAYVAGLLALELGRSQRAVLAFDRALALGHADEERVAAFHLWRARALDLEERRSEALTAYRYAIGLRADQAVRTAAVAGLTKRYNRRKASAIHVEMSLGDVAMP